jgi:hypothetical protein
MNQIVKVFKYSEDGTGAITATAAVPTEGGFRRVVSVTMHLSGDPGAEDFTITLDADAGAAYDTLLNTQAMSGVVDFVWFPDGEIILGPGDALDFAMTGAADEDYGLQTTMREVT